MSEPCLSCEDASAPLPIVSIDIIALAAFGQPGAMFGSDRHVSRHRIKVRIAENNQFNLYKTTTTARPIPLRTSIERLCRKADGAAALRIGCRALTNLTNARLHAAQRLSAALYAQPVGPSRHDEFWGEALHRLAVLVQRQASHAQNAAVGFRA